MAEYIARLLCSTSLEFISNLIKFIFDYQLQQHFTSHQFTTHSI